jgi:tRNA(adenine34) deaminase
MVGRAQSGRRTIAGVNYELFMGEALAEAQLARDNGGLPVAAVAVVNEAMVARAHDLVAESRDPTSHAVVVALREAARRLGPDALSDATIFTTVEPCAMCVGALLECNVEELVFALPDPRAGAAGGAVQIAQHAGLPRRLRVVSGIRRDEAEDLLAQAGSKGR